MRKALIPLALAGVLFSACGGDDNGDGAATDTGANVQDTVGADDPGPSPDPGKVDKDEGAPPQPDIVVKPPEDTSKDEDVGPAQPAESCREAVTCWAHCKLDEGCKETCEEGVEQSILDAMKPVQDCIGKLNCGGAPVQCLVDDCWDEYQTCAFDGASGTVKCSDLNDCVVACPAGDDECETGCIKQATLEAQKSYVKWLECVYAYAVENCGGVVDAACKKQAETTTCHTQYNFCLGDKG